MSWGEARSKWGKRIAVAAQGVIEEKPGQFRIIYDGTHHVGVYGRIRVRDQVRCPMS